MQRRHRLQGAGGSAERQAQFTHNEITRWARIARDAKVTLDS
jgi:hypothetical protein